MVTLIYNQPVKWVLAFPHLCQHLTLSDSYNVCPTDWWCVNLLFDEITRGISDIRIVFFWVFTFLTLNQTKTSVLLQNVVWLGLICHDCTHHLRKGWCDTSHLQLNITCWLIKCLEGLGLLSDNFYKEKKNFFFNINCHQPSRSILWNATNTNPVIASLGISPTKALVWLPNSLLASGKSGLRVPRSFAYREKWGRGVTEATRSTEAWLSLLRADRHKPI